MKKHPQDIIWQTIISSALHRFDLEAFTTAYGDLCNDRVLDTVLFLVIEGAAEGLTPEETAGHIHHDLQMLGYPFDHCDFLPFVQALIPKLEQEIKAATKALALLAEGQSIEQTLRQVNQQLGTEDTDSGMME